MKTKLLLLISVFMLSSISIPAVFAGTDATTTPKSADEKKKEKKEKKEKEEFDWEKVRPKKLSGHKDMDLYILTCDTLWYRIQSYRDSINFFQLDTIWATDSKGEVCKVIKIRDQDGTPRNFSESLKQGMDITFTGTSILMDVAMITLLNTSAALAFTDDPFLALGYTKCLKGGLNINKLAYKEVKFIVNATKKQIAQTKSMRKSQMEGSTDQAIILPKEEGEEPSMEDIKNLSDLDLGNSDNEVNLDDLENVDLNEITGEGNAG